MNFTKLPFIRTNFNHYYHIFSHLRKILRIDERLVPFIPVLMIGLLAANSGMASDDVPSVLGSMSFYKDHEQGWFFYKDPAPDEASKKPKPEGPAPPSKKAAPKFETPELPKAGTVE